MRKLLLASAALLSLLLLAGVVLPQDVSAQRVNEELCNTATSTGERPAFCVNDDTTKGQADPTNNALVGPNGVLTKVGNLMSVIVGVASVIVVVIGGLMVATSNGDSARVAKARQAIIYALVGIAVAVTVRLIIAFVLSQL